MPFHEVFFYLTLILLPTQLGYHLWPDWAMVIGRRLDYLSPTLFLTDITILLTLLSWVVSSFPLLKINNYLKLVVFVGFVGLNILFASSPVIAFSKWLKFLEFALFGFYIIKTKPSFSRSIWCLSFAVLYSSVIAIAQFFSQHSLGGVFWFLGERTFDISTPGIARIQILPSAITHYSLFIIHKSGELLRPYATFPHPNVLGGFLAVLLPLIIYKSTNGKSTNQWQNVSTNIVIALGLVALLLTFSRSAWIAGVVGLSAVLFFRFKSMKHRSFVVFLAFIGFVGLFLALPYFKSLTPDSESVFVRTELNSAAVFMWWNNNFLDNAFIPHTTHVIHRLLGVGLGNFLIELPKFYPHRDIFFLQPVHNIYLLILSEVGVIGLILFLFFIISIYRNKEYGIRNKGKNQKILSFIIRYSLFIILFIGLVDHYPLTLQQGQLLLTLLISFNLINVNNYNI